MQPTNPGYKTSEFYVTVVTTIVGLLNQSGVIGHPIDVAPFAGILSVIVAYILSRTVAKAATSVTPAA